ncbi:hypothetical protein TNCV_1090031 [Trichonephila clavipes]|uniref:Uncharacterized protein n=1 Tax=Trichonephila clavipes TaxID=2585209 RepID=A0A8X6VG04_TRICX|nr:hypothetical protein TNCV_1090031 [Trichonephila clavipes]
MDVRKRVVPSRHWGTLNSRRAASPLVWWVEGEERWVASDQPQGVRPQNWGGTETDMTSPFRLLPCLLDIKFRDTPVPI